VTSQAGRDAFDIPLVAELLDVAVAALGGGRREGQRRMVVEVDEALNAKRHLLVQAGTGTGKSLGYLVPAVRHAVVKNETVIVSTATLALQRQVITRDLPLVAEAIAPLLPRPPAIALLKGLHNYLCLQKAGGGYPVDPGAALFELPEEGKVVSTGSTTESGDEKESFVDQVRRLHVWAQETDTGDRDDLVPGVTDRAWRQVSVTAMECLGGRCPKVIECFGERARSKAREADVVVTNHAMLGIAASGSPGVLPEHGIVIVDEAHELSDRVTSAATVELSLTSIDHAARLARRHAAAETSALDAAAVTFGDLIAQATEGLFPLGLPDELREAVADVRDAARELLTRVKPETKEKGSTEAPDGGGKMAQSAVLLLFETAERMAAQDTSADVLWCERPHDGPSRLAAAPLNVAGLIRHGLLAEATGVFTSATLSLGGKFDAIAGSLGLPRNDKEDDDSTARWVGIDVGSPFDYPGQGILYVAKHLPPPGREPATEDQLDEITELIKAAGGRTLGLFSSRRAADAVAEAMRERLDFPIYAQGDDQLPTLIGRFAAEPESCLFGTISLWQGVDVPGDACRLIIIDRIPFPRPDDPVRSARTRAVEKAGGNGFMQISAAHAALMLAQGSGRLIRTNTDRGVVAVLDPRLATKRYGAYLTRSMPEFWRTTDPSVPRAALRRLNGQPQV